MDGDLQDQLAPWKRRRSANPPDLKQESAWARTLDWEKNDYDFSRLVNCILGRLDRRYRQEFGVRIDQLGDCDEVLGSARQAALWFSARGEQYRRDGIYSYLLDDFDRLLRKRARLLVRQRATFERSGL